MKRNWVDRWVYAVTQKPKHCVEVKNPPKTPLEKLLHPQEARQEQYNRWSRYHQVYSGSYLPKDKGKLVSNGWIIQNVGNSNHQVLQRKSTRQTVRYDSHYGAPPHAHWLLWWKAAISKSEYRKLRSREFQCEKVYYNRYGEHVSRIDPQHHLYFEEENDDR